MAGGFDPRNTENIEHFTELTQLCAEEGLAADVTFLRSFSDAEKVSLLHRCSCLLYTPSNEHFGIVPLEAMYCKRAVIAVNSGGPLETVVAHESLDPSKRVNGQTGFLCEVLRCCPFASCVCSPLNRIVLGCAGKKITAHP